MDAEIMKIKKAGNRKDGKAKFMDLETRKDLVYNLNRNFSDIFSRHVQNDDDINAIVEDAARSLYDLLEGFASIDVYPDYFWRIIMQMKVITKKVVANKRKDELTMREQDIIESHDRYLYDKIRTGIYLDNKEKPIDVNDNYVELLSFYSVFQMPCNNKELFYSKSFLEGFALKCISYNYDLLNTDDIIDDVKCMMDMLFEYMCFFAQIGVNPKKYVDEIMEERLNKENRHK